MWHERDMGPQTWAKQKGNDRVSSGVNDKLTTKGVICNPQYQTVIFRLSTEGGLQASPFAGSWLLAGGWISIIQSVVARDQGIAGLHSTAQYYICNQ